MRGVYGGSDWGFAHKRGSLTKQKMRLVCTDSRNGFEPVDGTE
jgi:hypothetical protein